MFEGKTAVVTGGAGSVGAALVKQLLEHTRLRKIRVFDNNEYELFKLGRTLNNSRIVLCLGDIRDYNRVKEVCAEADIIIHLAALKNLELTETNPNESILTNIIGTQNITQAVKYERADLFINFSSDKAVNPTSLYGATKLIGEKLTNYLAETTTIKAFNIRSCNIIETRGNIYDIIASGNGDPIPVTNLDMTRYWISITELMRVCMKLLSLGISGKTYIPKCTRLKLSDIIPENVDITQIGIRSGEKFHEALWTAEESECLLDDGLWYTVVR